MKNFPHQINDLEKLTAGLSVVHSLIGKGKDVSDDGMLGQDLARAHVYTFRNKKLTVTQALAREKKKKPTNRGTEAAARDIRRLFHISSLIKGDVAPSHWSLTELGKELIAAKKEAGFAVWREAMLTMSLADPAGNVSHPYKILLRLVSDRPGIETAKLMLALEAVSDTEDEYQRILDLSNATAAKIQDLTSPSNALNAVKILPAIARQLGDIVTSKGKNYAAGNAISTEEGFTPALPDAAHTTDAAISAPKKPVAADKIGSQPNFSDTLPTNVDLSKGIEIRKRRTKEHQNLVKDLGTFLAAAGYSLYERPYDCLAVKGGTGNLLCEVKTLDGSPADERRQCELAVGQLAGYRFFDMPPEHSGNPDKSIIVFTREPSQKTREFIRTSGITLVFKHGADWVVDTAAGSSPFLPDDLFT